MTAKSLTLGPDERQRVAAVGTRVNRVLLGVALLTALTFGNSNRGLAHSDDPVVADLQARVAALEAKLSALAVVANGDWVISGVNVRIPNGLGETASINGTGNLIVGYDEADLDDVKTGSHNLVVGPRHSYADSGGLVAGADNEISGAHATVVGGLENTASGHGASVGGGFRNSAAGEQATVSSGAGNEASGFRASAAGGACNLASGHLASVTGGSNNEARGTFSSVTGGGANGPEGGNKALDAFTSVTGGVGNVADAPFATITGGRENSALGVGSSVTGGRNNEASGHFSSVSGGGSLDPALGNRATGHFSHVSGGQENVSRGEHTSILGGHTNVAGDPSQSDDVGKFATVSGAQQHRQRLVCKRRGWWRRDQRIGQPRQRRLFLCRRRGVK